MVRPDLVQRRFPTQRAGVFFPFFAGEIVTDGGGPWGVEVARRLVTADGVLALRLGATTDGLWRAPGAEVDACVIVFCVSERYGRQYRQYLGPSAGVTLYFTQNLYVDFAGGFGHSIASPSDTYLHKNRIHARVHVGWHFGQRASVRDEARPAVPTF